MVKKIIIAPSLLSADPGRLYEEVSAVLAAGENWLHFDVMDNHFVPNLTFGPHILAALKKKFNQVFFDVHLMTYQVDKLIIDFAKAGASLISVHPESSVHLNRSLQLIADQGCQVGLVLNPATPLNWLDHTMDYIHLLLIMSVNPGFPGQNYIAESTAKLRQARLTLNDYKMATGKDILLEVDGGVNLKNIAEIKDAGVDVAVAGSAIFNSKDYKKTIAELMT